MVNKPEDFYWAQLKRLQQFKSKKWYDPQSPVAELIVLPETKNVLAIEECGIITSLKTDDSKAVNAPIEWQISLPMPEDLKISGKHEPVEICHAAFDNDLKQLFFSFFPVEAGVYQIGLADVLQEVRRLAEEAEMAPPESGRNSRSSRGMSIVPGPEQSSERSQTVPETTEPGAKEDLTKSKTLFPSLASLDNKKRYLSLKCFIKTENLADGFPSWYFGIAVAANILYVCHRNRPNAITMWSTAQGDTYGQKLNEITLPEDSPITDFQPYNCAVVIKNLNLTSLAVIDSHSRLLVFSVRKDNQKGVTVTLKETVSSEKGKELGQLNFPLSVQFVKRGINLELWVADGANDRIQLFEQSKPAKPKEPTLWKPVWASAAIPHTVIATVSGTTHLSSTKDKNALQTAADKTTGWLRCLAVPCDANGIRYLIVSLYENEVVCFGTS